MASRKVRGLDDRISKGRVINSSEKVFEIETHRMQNISGSQKKAYEKMFFSERDSAYFRSPKLNANVRVVFNSPQKEYVEKIYGWRWGLIYTRH